MYIFTIQAIDAFGQAKKVEVRAASSMLALNLIQNEGFKAQSSDILDAKKEGILTQLGALKGFNLFRRASPQSILRLIRLIGGSLSRGKTIKATLEFIVENEDDKSLRQLVGRLKKRTESPFTSQVEIFSGFPGYFDEAFLGIVEAGETSSNLGGYLLDYAKEKRQQQALHDRFKAILAKRLITFLMVLGVAMVVVAFVIPQFETLFGSELEMPWAMQALMNFSDVIIHHGYTVFILLLCLLVLGIYLVTHHSKVRWWFHDLLLSSPLVGRTLKTYYTAQFCYFLSTLLTKNVDIIRAIQIVIKQTRNVCMAHAYKRLIHSMQAGDDLFSAILKEADGGRPYLISSIVQAAKVGAETASLGATLMDVRRDLDELLQARVERAIKFFSAIFYIIIILIAAFIAYGIGSAILVFYNNAQNLI